MPSPLGHALGGIAAGWLLTGRAARRPLLLGRATLPGWTRDVLLFGSIAVAPDLDLLAGTHSTYTHSIGAVALVFAVALVVTRGQVRRALAIAGAWATHVLFDWMGSDTSAPIGVMALWPFSTDHYQSSLYVFDAISRRYWMGWTFVEQNATAILREIAIVGPAALIAYVLARRRTVGGA